MTLDLREFLDEKPVAELEAIHGFWLGGAAPDEPQDLREALFVAMTDAERVRRRVELLSPQVSRILAAAVQNPGFEITPDQVRADGVPGVEIDGAFTRLVRDGFMQLVKRGATRTRRAGFAYRVPGELGEHIAPTLVAGPQPVDRVLSLLRFTRTLAFEELVRRASLVLPVDEETPRREVLQGLVEAGRVEERIRRLDGRADRTLVQRLYHEFGGILTRSQFEKLGFGGEEWSERRLSRVLENALLGTCLTLSLEEYGIGLMESCAVGFHECVEAVLLQGPAPDGPFERVADSGIDWLSDLAALQDEIARGEVKLTQKGELYKSVLRRFEARKVTHLEGFSSADDLAVTLTRTLVDLGLAQATADRLLEPTARASTWDAQPPHLRVRQALEAMLGQADPGEPVFHLEALRSDFIRVLGSLEIGRWYDPMAVPFAARNRYLARLERDGVKERYQARFQYAGPPIQSDPARLAWSLFEFTRRRLHPLGIVDLAFRGERVAAIRLTTLGAIALGVAEPDPEDDAKRRLVVHADFEILLFPEGRDDPLIHSLDRFATRVKSENVYHFRLDRDSVTRALASGVTAEEILHLLEGHGRNPVPQNVEFSVREWAERIRFVTCDRVFLLEAPDEETTDKIQDLPGLRPLVLDRIGPTMLSLRERPDKPALRRELEELGVFVR